MKWNRYPNSENSWEPVEGLENAQDLVLAWWTENIPGEEFLIVFSSYITVCFTPTKNGFEQHAEAPVVHKGFWEPHLDSDYNSKEI